MRKSECEGKVGYTEKVLTFGFANRDFLYSKSPYSSHEHLVGVV